MNYKIMIVEDDPDIAELVSFHLHKFGFSVHLCRDFSNVLKEFEEVEPHLVLLDINLPAYDGFYWCGKLRAKSPCPIIFLSSRNADSDQVYAMMNGGDDFVTKPFSLDVITAKITALLRRTYGEYATSVSNELRCGDCTFSQNRLTLNCNGREAELSKTEAGVLRIIFEKYPGVASREELLSETEKILPYAFAYNTWTEEADASHDLAIIEDELQNLPGYKTVEVHLWYPDLDSRTPIMAQSDYNQIMDFLGREPVSVSDTGVYLVTGNADEVLKEVPNSTESFLQSNHLSLSVEGQSDKVITLTGFTGGICVVSDAVFEPLRPKMTEKIITAFSYDEWEKNSESPDAIFTALENTMQKGDANVVSAYRYYRSSQIQNNLTLYIGGMLSFVFLLAVASFIYSRLYSELDAECRKFKGIVKIGLSRKELSLVLSRLLFLILCVPFGLALIYLWIGVLITEQITLVSTIPVAIGFTAVLIVLQIILYLWIRSSYRKTVFQQVFEN